MLELTEHTSNNRQRILSRILVLRVIALLVALAVLLGFQFYLQRELNYSLLYSIAVMVLIYTVFTLLRLRRSKPVTDIELFVHLLMDGIILLVLVFYSGRASNPFIYYLLVLVAISAAIFNGRLAWSFAALSVFAYTALLYVDIGAHLHHMFTDFQLHLVGMWVNFVGSTMLISYFVSTLATALRDREVRLAKAREATLKNEQLIGIGALAASTMHALGTPLSTMAVTLSELKHDQVLDSENADLLLSQIERCKQTMGKLALIAESKKPDAQIAFVGDLIEELEEHYHLLCPRIMPCYDIEGSARDKAVNESVLLLYALINLVDNSIRAAKAEVLVKVAVQEDVLIITIVDDGPGVPAEMLEDFGKPNFSRQNGGLGIGVFLANTTLEKLDGSIVLFNPQESRSGKTTVVVELPLVKNE
ncbi:two-component system, sensor histidine kinase RegB [Alteromonadaceae bacterium Bs31]|nr:two-component system, sensor histidine kinase RegB [Alteromonadaceae bacterium Bs31]